MIRVLSFVACLVCAAVHASDLPIDAPPPPC